MKTKRTFHCNMLWRYCTLLAVILTTIHLEANPQLPEISSFNAELLHGHEVLLQWNHHATPSQVKHYIIERSVDGVTFEVLDQVLPASLSGPCMVIEHIGERTTYFCLKGVTRSGEMIYLGLAKVQPSGLFPDSDTSPPDNLSIVSHH